VNLLKLADRSELTVLGTPVEDALGERGPDAGELFELVCGGGIEVHGTGWRNLASAACVRRGGR
jgi:hypothetical protein